MTDAFEQARAVTDAVLYEGYLLYPYRASAAKNRVRWQFGVLVPPSFASDDTGEYGHCRTECVLEPHPDANLHVRLRFLQVRRRVVEELTDDGAYRPVDVLKVDGREFREWDEAVERERDVVVGVDELRAGEFEVNLDQERGAEVEELRDQHGDLRGRLVRRHEELAGRMRLSAEPLLGPYGGTRLRVVVDNTSRWQVPEDVTREDALRYSLVAAHLLLGLDAGVFLSLFDPPEWAKPAVQECENVRLWPVLLGAGDRGAAMLSSPIILYDNPAVAPESRQQLCDATEIDEILTLRTMALTDEEKEQARGTDERAREIVDGVDDMPAEVMERLHGTMRYLRSVVPEQSEREPRTPTAPPETPWWDPGADASVSPDTDSVDIAGVPVAKDSKVRLDPGHRSTDAQDMFLKGRVATVQAVFLDVDDEWYLAVTIDDDPAAEIQSNHGRYRYFFTDEVQPLTTGSEPDGEVAR